MNTEDSEFQRIEREQAMRTVPDAIHHTDPRESLEYITGWNDCRAAMLAKQPAQQETVAWIEHEWSGYDLIDRFLRNNLDDDDYAEYSAALDELCTPQRTWVGLTEREVELIDGMIEVQLHHAAQCDNMNNRTMADKQKGWDMERVELLRKLKENT